MKFKDLFIPKPTVCELQLKKATDAAIATPKKLDAIEKKLKDLDETLVKLLEKEGCKIAS